MLNFYELKLNNKDPVYLQAVLYVKRQILLRNAVSGDKLPSRREVAAQLSINPNTVQKAFKLMEDEGFVRTSSTLGSVIYVDDVIFRAIEEELTRELVQSFVDSAKEIRLSFKTVVELISEHWE
ncbi:GntR family transcriptional regulator [Cohnella sp. LGH]|uniref:DNA-binding transcriptional regulator YhcF (GntR family) n=1 Tax=Cohnella phaseoli TaxID=456490 RepID=A0A3D9HZW7_9BACL|nr:MULTISPECIES: GntR family transcriptional regulator [Cohnella]QTH40455.1 GntR family transcriptional regulator [Cohnella sp. LGH]RED55013.1 DNA-binding transcriptional regulator YhcF (GntR family) [Cohnella phaseoli]